MGNVLYNDAAPDLYRGVEVPDGYKRFTELLDVRRARTAMILKIQSYKGGGCDFEAVAAAVSAYDLAIVRQLMDIDRIRGDKRP